MARKNPVDPYAAPEYRKMKSGALVRYAIFAVLGVVAVGGALAIMNMPSAPLGEARQAAYSEPTLEDYASAKPSTATVTEDGAPAEAAASPEAVPEAAPAPAREARVAPRTRSIPTSPPPEEDLNAAAEPKPLAPPASASPSAVPLTPAPASPLPSATPISPVPASPPAGPTP
ncbi:MAG: hypothetical protein JNJ73_04185 [Hyphomonadaceae bacterium]|nr:hypothetical protein [Hyphomonadaceae bacterium]